MTLADCVVYPYTSHLEPYAVSVDGRGIATDFIATIDGSGPYVITGAGA
jgi:hypothetical protein